MNKTSFYFSVNTQFENLGDALINRELILEASKYGQACVDVSRCPDSFVTTIGLNSAMFPKNIAVFKGLLLLILKIVKSRSKGEKVFYFLNPGGLGKPRSNKQRISAIVYNMLLLFYVVIGVKVCHVGISHEKSGYIDLLISKMRAKLTSYLYVRDKGSFKYLNENGFGVKGVYPDLAFYLYGNEKKASSERAKIGFSFRFDGRNISSKDSSKSFILSVFDRYKDQKKYAFISQVKRDDSHMHELAAWFLINTGCEAEVVCCSDDIEFMVSLYSDCDTVYSNRLHVLLLSSSSGSVPMAVIDLELNKKVSDLYLDIGLKELIIDLNSPETYSLRGGEAALLDSSRKTQYLDLKNMFPEIISIEPS